jgi:hypothetical protein
MIIDFKQEIRKEPQLCSWWMDGMDFLTNKIGNVRVNVTLRRVHVIIVAMEKQ